MNHRDILKLKFIVWCHIYVGTVDTMKRERKNRICTDSSSLVKLEFYKFNSPKQPPDVIGENSSQMTVHVADIFLVWSSLK